MSFTLAIVGRPNVGKSRLFNRLVGKKSAIVSRLPGTTRDRREGTATLAGLTFSLIDTAGLERVENESLEAAMMAQTERAVDKADVLLFLVDGKDGITPMDRHFAAWLQRKQKPIILAVNKCDSKQADAGLSESYTLGFGAPIALSAEQGLGLSELYDALIPLLNEEESSGERSSLEPMDEPLRLALIGRPNVGKSSLFNTMVKEERVITGPQAGITRDTIEVAWAYRGKTLMLMDTAGMRRKARITEKLERSAVADSLSAIRYAHVVVLLLDATQSVDKQELALAGHVLDEGRALVVAANKCDKIGNKKSIMMDIQDRLQQALPQARNIPVIPISARDGDNLHLLMDKVFSLYGIWNRRISTAKLNRWLNDALERNPTPLSSGRNIRLRYMTQIKTRPPAFALFSSSKIGNLPESYLRYLINDLRDSFGLEGVPLRLHIRKAENPFK